ncbi:MAG: HD domain-containing protein [Endomicrobia bacterium]|nr:HD domain-containing protein [Endomicrobiia bacterium]
MLTYRDIKSLFEFAAHKISELLNAERTTIFLLNKQTQSLWTFVAEGLEIKELSLPISIGIAGYVARTGETVNIKEAYKDERFSPIVDQKTGFRTKTILCVPIKDRQDNIIGVIEVLNKKHKKVFTLADEELLKVFCSELGSIIVNIRLYEEIQVLFESLLKSFAAAVDARDPVTKGHSIRVSKYAISIAKALGLSPLEIKILEYAAILHDIGKIGIPDNILLKPEKFTQQEYEIMKTHVEIAKDILSKLHLPEEYKDIIFIATTHHEFLNGSGYPKGLKGEQIPLLSRILCIADIYDALVSYDRPYKPACSVEEAIKILYEMAQEGKIDKQIIDIFVSKKLYETEQRKFVRVNKEVSFRWRRLTQDDLKSVFYMISKTQNISLGGLNFFCEEELEEGSFLEIELYLPDYTIETIAKVVYCLKESEKYYKIGITFINLPQQAQEKLYKFLDTSITSFN